MVAEAYPSSLCITLKLAPAEIASDAQVCLNAWGVSAGNSGVNGLLMPSRFHASIVSVAAAFNSPAVEDTRSGIDCGQ